MLDAAIILIESLGGSRLVLDFRARSFILRVHPPRFNLNVGASEMVENLKNVGV